MHLSAARSVSAAGVSVRRVGQSRPPRPGRLLCNRRLLRDCVSCEDLQNPQRKKSAINPTGLLVPFNRVP